MRPRTQNNSLVWGHNNPGKGNAVIVDVRLLIQWDAFPQEVVKESSTRHLLLEYAPGESSPNLLAQLSICHVTMSLLRLSYHRHLFLS